MCVCVCVCVSLPLIVQITNMCNTAIKCCKSIEQFAGNYCRRICFVAQMILRRCYFKYPSMCSSITFLSPCEGQSYCIRLSRSLSKCNCSHIELRVIKTVCYCSFPFPRIDKSQGIDCTVIELLCNIRIICE